MEEDGKATTFVEDNNKPSGAEQEQEKEEEGDEEVEEVEEGAVF